MTLIFGNLWGSRFFVDAEVKNDVLWRYRHVQRQSTKMARRRSIRVVKGIGARRKTLALTALHVEWFEVFTVPRLYRVVEASQ